MKLVKQAWPRLVLYAVLVVIMFSSVSYWGSSKHSSLSENFLAGSIEIAITVILIDGLLYLERMRRVKVLNVNKANASTYYLGLIIVKFMQEFQYPIDPNGLEVVSMNNAALREKVSIFFKSAEYDQYLRDIKDIKPEALKKAKSIERLITDSVTSVIKSLESFQPYPDPALVQLVNDALPSAIANLRVIKVMYKLNETLRSNPVDDSTALVEDIINDEIGKITDRNIKKMNVHGGFRAFMDAMLTVHERAERNKVHYDI